MVKCQQEVKIVFKLNIGFDNVDYGKSKALGLDSGT